MKVFITWSGETSGALADVLRQWLPTVIQAVRPYYSPDDVMKGTRWTYEIAQELEGAQVGLICLTRENLKAPWIMYEAGALSKSLDNAKVCPILFGVDQSQLEGPLVQFQACEFAKTDIKRVVRMINAQLGDSALAANVLDRVFEMWWPQLEEEINNVLAADQSAESETEDPRTEKELLAEVLRLTRLNTRRPQTTAVISAAAAQDLGSSYLTLAEESLLAVTSSLSAYTLVEMAKPVRYVLKYSRLRGPEAEELSERISTVENQLTKRLASGRAEVDINESDFEDIPF